MESLEKHSDIIKKLQKNTNNIRNLCVIAHVDHGKTSLVDCLISYNNIINPRLAGDIRYMDSRPDEQERCITMKSSSISIAYTSHILNENFLINLIDSPGHVDFASEIFSALKICDGAIIVIDVVEGICSQTESVIKQAWDEKIKCVLVLNKIDRLITEVQLEPLEAYHHLNNLLEKANSLMGSLIVRDININSDNAQINRTNTEEEVDIDKLIEEKENEIYFSPSKGNVVFASAIDNWGFTVGSFSEILSKRLGFKREGIEKILWGDFFFSKDKKVYTDPGMANNNKPMFVEFVLDNIYKLYKMVLNEKNPDKITKAATAIKVTLNQKDMNVLDKNPRSILKSILRQWLPVPETVYEVIIKNLPSPIKGFTNKLEILFPQHKLTENNIPMITKIKDYLNNNDSIDLNTSDIPNIAFISKMVAIPVKNISNINPNTEQTDEVKFLAFARNYCGTFKQGDEYYVIGPKHDPKTNTYDIHKFKFDHLYFFMGQYLEELKEVAAGNIFSITGLENYVYKTATVSSVFECPAIIPNNLNKNSIIKVSITTEDLKDMPRLIDGLKKLYKSDPAVDYYVQSNGEHILATSGEVHLQRCVLDLEDQLAKVKLKISTPIVNFKEGLANTTYTYKKIKIASNTQSNIKTETEETIKKERKKDLNKLYVLDEGDTNIDLDNEKEILKSCTPMVITKEPKRKKPEEKVVKNKVKDFKSIKDKTYQFLERKIENENKVVEKKFRGYAEDETPNKSCAITISAIGMSTEVIAFLEQNEKLLKEINIRNYTLPKEIYDSFLTFKKGLIDLIENKKLKQLIENNLFCFGLNNSEQNILIIKNISKKHTYFQKVTLEENINTSTENNNLDLNTVKTSESIELTESNSIKNKEENSSISSPMKSNKKTTQEIKENLLEDQISNHLQEKITPREFYNSLKSGFDLAIANGPLCKENMYGVIFIIEEIILKNQKNKEIKEANITNETNNNEINIVDEKVIDQDANSKSEIESINTHLFGPFLGQLIGTVKDCCRKAFLNGEPRLFEALYLCEFQIRQEHVGKIYSVISKRRGKIINEKSNDESIIITIEAVVPVVESFGFVEEIRKKSSGMANPMLQFYKWEMIDIDPFYVPVTQEVLDNFGSNIDTPNLAKNYINKTRMRKGLIIDEKIIKNADKQSNLSKKR